ncbi:MAG: FmdE family protein [Desulforhopalus sp.]
MYIPESIRHQDDYKACVNFHGHTCMGVTIGYLAAKLGMEKLRAIRSVDEELIAIVETDACCCDAIQVLTGCTFGKGNFFYRDYGKMAFTFASRTTNQGVRLVLRNEIFEVPKEEQHLADKIGAGKATSDDIKSYEKLYEARGLELFSRGPEAFFDTQEITIDLPPMAPRAPSERCDICGEMVMSTKLRAVKGERVCRACRP